MEQDKRTKDGTKQEETKGEKSKLPANLDEDNTDDQEDTDSQEDGEYIEELSEDEKKYIDTDKVYKSDLYRDIEALSVSELPQKDNMQTCTTCNVKSRDLTKHQKLMGCKMYGYPETRQNRKGRE